jgi:hypothetical protein
VRGGRGEKKRIFGGVGGGGGGGGDEVGFEVDVGGSHGDDRGKRERIGRAGKGEGGHSMLDVGCWISWILDICICILFMDCVDWILANKLQEIFKNFSFGMTTTCSTTTTITTTTTTTTNGSAAESPRVRSEKIATRFETAIDECRQRCVKEAPPPVQCREGGST